MTSCNMTHIQNYDLIPEASGSSNASAFIAHSNIHMASSLVSSPIKVLYQDVAIDMTNVMMGLRDIDNINILSFSDKLYMSLSNSY